MIQVMAVFSTKCQPILVIIEIILIFIQINSIYSEKLSNNCEHCSSQLEFIQRIKRNLNVINDNAIESSPELHANDANHNNSMSLANNRSVFAMLLNK